MIRKSEAWSRTLFKPGVRPTYAKSGLKEKEISKKLETLNLRVENTEKSMHTLPKNHDDQAADRIVKPDRMAYNEIFLRLDTKPWYYQDYSPEKLKKLHKEIKMIEGQVTEPLLTRLILSGTQVFENF